MLRFKLLKSVITIFTLVFIICSTSDEAFGYKEGDIRGGISIIISLEQLGF
jgi:hypothetical protein